MMQRQKTKKESSNNFHLSNEQNPCCFWYNYRGLYTTVKWLMFFINPLYHLQKSHKNSFSKKPPKWWSFEGFFNLGLSKTLPGSLEDLGVARHGGVAWVGVARRCSLPGMKPMMDPVAQGLVAWRAASLEAAVKLEKWGDGCGKWRICWILFSVVLMGFLWIDFYWFLCLFDWLVDRQAIYEFFVQLHKKGNFLFGSNISASLHTWAGQVKGGGPARHRQIQRANAVVRYGRDEGPGGELLLPVTVEHDRSRHAERRGAGVSHCIVRPKKGVVDAVDLKWTCSTVWASFWIAGWQWNCLLRQV